MRNALHRKPSCAALAKALSQSPLHNKVLLIQAIYKKYIASAMQDAHTQLRVISVSALGCDQCSSANASKH